MDINKTIEKLEEYNAYKRSQDPFNIEMNRLMNDVYPYEKLYSIFKLGQAHMLSTFKNHIYQYFCDDDKDYIDEIVIQSKDDQEMKGFLDILIKGENKDEINT